MSAFMFPAYSGSEKGILSSLPFTQGSYAELCRINQASSFLYLCLPTFLVNSSLSASRSQLYSLLYLVPTDIIPYTTNFLFHGSEVSCNDIMDYDVDRQVFRISLSPIARGVVTA